MSKNISIDKNLIISFPKCGRTWLRVVMGVTLCSLNNASFENPLIYEGKRGFPYFIHSISSNNKLNVANMESWKELPTKPLGFRNITGILLIRNPLDVMVSYYCDRHYRSVGDNVKHFKGSISDFIRTDYFGINKLIHFWNIWKDHCASVVKYEEMHEDILGVLKKIFTIFGFNIDELEPHFKTAIEFAKFENMKKREQQNYFHGDQLRTKGDGSLEAMKVRKGKICGYHDYLNEDDINYIKKQMEKMNCPFYSVDEV